MSNVKRQRNRSSKNKPDKLRDSSTWKKVIEASCDEKQIHQTDHKTQRTKNYHFRSGPASGTGDFQREGRNGVVERRVLCFPILAHERNRMTVEQMVNVGEMAVDVVTARPGKRLLIDDEQNSPRDDDAHGRDPNGRDAIRRASAEPLPGSQCARADACKSSKPGPNGAERREHAFVACDWIAGTDLKGIAGWLGIRRRRADERAFPCGI